MKNQKGFSTLAVVIIVVVVAIVAVSGVFTWQYFATKTNNSSASSATINKSSLVTTSGFPTITGTATNTSSLAIDIDGSVPASGSDSNNMIAIYAGTVPVLNGNWSFAPSASSSVRGGPQGLEPGTYTVVVGETEKSALATDTLTVTGVTSTNQTADWKTYTNTQYGFEFQFPSEFGNAQIFPESVLDCNSQAYIEVGLVSFKNIGISIACPNGVQNSSSSKGSKTAVTIAGRQAYTFEYISAVGYANKEAYIPLSSGNYLGIIHSFKGGRPADYLELSQTQWQNMLSTFKFTK